jgi:imidazolonepropionase-like amidohydrolase
VTVLAVRATAGWLGPGRLVRDVIVVLDGASIAYAGPAGQAPPHAPDQEIVVDGFVMPGVVDRHVHMGLADALAVVVGGTTAVRDLGWPPGVIHRVAVASQDPAFDGPYVRAVGPIVTCRGGYPTRAGWAPEGTGLEVRGPEQAAEAAERVLREGTAGAVKVALNADAGAVLDDRELAAVCGAAHAKGAIVTAHVQGAGQAARALVAGVDEFAHCPWSERLADDVIHRAAARMRIVSTLDIHSHGRDTPELRIAVDNLRRFVHAGGRVVYGTDLGNGPIPPGIHHGEAVHLAAAGLGPEAILEAMTFRPLDAGERGDLVALAGDPLEDLDALRRPILVLRQGRRLR